MMKSVRTVLFGVGALALLAGCSNAKEQLGLTRNAPDEFAVVKRAPLEMPPEFSLRPPAPGAPRPQEMATQEQAAVAVLGAEESSKKKSKAPARGEDALMADADVRYNPDIRSIVDYEATQEVDKNQPVVKKLLNIGKDQLPAAKTVDANAEAQRIQRNAAEGKPVTEGKTPSRGDND